VSRTLSGNGAPARRWEVAATALASGSTVEAAAAAVGVNPRSVFRWLRDIRFARRVQEIRDAAFSAAVGELTASCTAAARKLAELLENPNPMIQLAAARALIGSAVKGRDSVDGDNRFRAEVGELEKLEAQRQGASWLEQRLAERDAEKQPGS
jgi:transposase-like protein